MHQKLEALKLHFLSGRLGRHLSLSFLQVLADSGTMMLLTFLVARHWGAELFGFLGMLLVGVHFVSMIVDGLTTTQTKIISEQEALKPGTGYHVAKSLFISIALFAIPASILLGLGTWWLVHDEEVVDSIDFVLVMFLAYGRILRSSLEACMRALRQFSIPAILAIIIGPTHFIVTAILVFMGGEIVTYLTLLAIAQFAAVFALLKVLNNGLKLNSLPESIPSFTKPMFNYAYPLMFRGMIGFMYIKVNIPLIEHYTTLAEVGAFRLAEQFLLIPMLITSALVSAMAPRVASLTALTQPERLGDLVQKAYLTLLLLMGAFTVVFYISPLYLTRLFPGYETAAVIIELFAITLIVRSFSVLCTGCLLIYSNHGALATGISVTGALLNLFVVWYLLHDGGTAIDAALGTTLVHVVISFVAVVATHRAMKIPFRILPVRS